MASSSCSTSRTKTDKSGKTGSDTAKRTHVPIVKGQPDLFDEQDGVGRLKSTMDRLDQDVKDHCMVSKGYHMLAPTMTPPLRF